jgi:hypothetical protein
LEAYSDAAQGDEFGHSVALSKAGSTALVGAYGKNGSAGAAYVFVRSGTAWTQQEKLIASDTASGDYFGVSVALSKAGSTALVGADLKDNRTGAAYVFTRSGTTWTQQQELTASDAAQGDEFGLSVALAENGSTALVGAPFKGGARGVAYVYAAGVVSTPTSTATPSTSNTPTGTPTPTASSTPTGTITPTAIPTATATGGEFTYHIQLGWNLIALPGATTTPVYASGFLVGLLFVSNGSIAALYGLTNNVWSPYLINNHQNGNGLSGQDFALQQGVGYLLYSDHKVDFTISLGEGIAGCRWHRGTGDRPHPAATAATNVLRSVATRRMPAPWRQPQRFTAPSTWQPAPGTFGQGRGFLV